MPPELPEPWRGFLTDLDGFVTHDVQLHCCGGFVVTVLYGLTRTTADLDVLSIIPHGDQRISRLSPAEDLISTRDATCTWTSLPWRPIPTATKAG
jgi:hypothetical protein